MSGKTMKQMSGKTSLQISGKCQFAKTETDWLDYKFTQSGTAAIETKTSLF